MAIYWTHDEQGREPRSIAVGKRPRVRGSPCDHRTAGPEQVLIADLIAFWLVWNAGHIDRMREAPRRVLLRQAERLGSFWRGMAVAGICTATSLRYQIGRNANSVRSELARLRTIVDFGARCGLVHLGARALDYALPLRPPRRRQWHCCSRAKVARLVRAAYKGDGERAGTIPVARLVLCACCLGVPTWAAERASFEQEEVRPWADLEGGVLYPRPVGDPPRRGNTHTGHIPIPTRLLMHMRRWRNGRPGEPGGCYVVEPQGAGWRREFRRLRRRVFDEERSREVTCQALRNTCTWWLYAGEASTEIIRRFRSLAPDLMRKHFFTGHFPPWWPRARLRLCGDGGR